jgi:ribosomal-protein-alanine N-acetyltransferase
MSNNIVIIEPLTAQDASAYASLYNQRNESAGFEEDSFLPDETPEAFTRRIISLCEVIFTIRTVDNPTVIIGDCALHHLNKATKEIEIGGTLMKAYRGKGYMQAAFELLTRIAKDKWGIEALMAKTNSGNTRAIKFANKSGFVIVQQDDTETVLRKQV